MQGNKNFEAVEEAFHAMTAEAAEKCREIMQMYAELYPRPLKLALVRSGPRSTPNKQLAMLKKLGELSPIGLCLINWNTRMIEWRNGAYDRVFLPVADKAENEEVPIGSLVPDFTDLGIEAMFDQVARTGEPLQLSGFPLPMPAGLTHWDASLAALPSTDGETTYLFLQIQRAQGVIAGKSLAA